MSCGCGDTCTCGCCAGTSVATPIAENNSPGLPAIAYRTGTWATFNETMLARLSSSDYPALAGLKTRANDDFSIALLDASAVVLDILTFYQERLANESYLRTATQLYSLIQLSQLIGYQPSPGVSASVYLAFSLSAAPGLPPNPTNTAIAIPAGTTVQSVPGQGQTPQAFQTSGVILAKPDWNALAVQTGIPWTPNSGDTSVYLQGTSTQLNPGDAFLIVGDERGGSLATGSASDPTDPHWDVRIVNSVTPDSVNGRTLITWSEGLGSGSGVSPAQVNPQFYALRQRAALFGYNAVNPIMLTKDAREALCSAGLLNGDWPPDWAFGLDDTTNVSLASEALVDLDNVYSKVVPGGWIALIRPTSDHARTPAGFVSLFAIEQLATVSRSDYSLSAKITRVLTDSNSSTEGQLTDDYTATRSVSALAQSELLPATEQPLDYPLYGTIIDLETVRDDLSAIQAVAVSGSNPQLVVKPGVTVTFNPYDASGTVTFGPGSMLTLIEPPPTVFNPDGSIPDWDGLTTPVSLVVADANGRLGTVEAALSSFAVAPAPSNAPLVQEVALVTSVSQVSSSQNPAAITPARTRIVLATPLINCYDRTVTTVNANVGAATAGSPVTELLGNGAAATPNQTFTLKQTPLTYTQALTPTGSASSLTVAVNGAKWSLVPTLYSQPPQAQVFTTMNLTGGKAQVIFGDGVEGSTLPTGQNNIIATYRVGLGAAGNVGAGAITTLVDRPVGVNGVINPLPATGGQDPQSVSDIQTNAPMSVQTLGRAVSITDYQNFADTFAGIAKASALWIPSGFYRGVFLTVAAAGGSALPPANLTLNNLIASLTAYGNPGVALRVVSFWETLFGLEADLTYNPAYSVDAVDAAVMALLNSTYSFAKRSFGQGVSGDELAALIQGVAGVVAVNVTKVKVIATSAAGDLGSAGYSVANWQNWIQQKQQLTRTCSGSASAICPYIPIPQLDQLPDPAEILVISPNPTDVVLGVMS
ncbi:MAG: putative baseplate assembly protein [Candidatus Korobacteraceae bacterium]